LEEILKEFIQIMENPEIALFAGVWVIAFLLKNYTKMNNNYIPFVVVAAGVLLSLALISVSIQGAVFGAVIGVFLVGGHSFAKHAGKLIDN